MLSDSDKWWASILIGLIFIIFASGPAFSISNELLSGVCLQTFYGSGGPTLLGMLIHAIITILIVRLAMELAFVNDECQ